MLDVVWRLPDNFHLCTPRHVPRLVPEVHNWFQNGLPGISPDVIVRGLNIQLCASLELLWINNLSILTTHYNSRIIIIYI